MSIEDEIIQDLTPGVRITIEGAVRRYKRKYSTTQKALRKLYLHGFLTRHEFRGERNSRCWTYEGKQERLV